MRARRLPAVFFASAAVSFVAVGAVSCRETVVETRPQLMVVIDTDAVVPDDLTGFSYELQQNGVPAQSEAVRELYDGGSGDKLPGTLAFVVGEQSPGALFAVRVWGVSGAQRVSLREVQVRMPTVAQGSRMLLMPIQRACLASSRCAGGSGSCEPVPCYDGENVDRSLEIPTGNLPAFDPARVFGGGDDKGQGGSCFDSVACFDETKTLRLAPTLEARATGEVCVVKDASLGVAIDPAIVNFAVQRFFAKDAAKSHPPQLCVTGDTDVRCYAPLSIRPGDVSAANAALLAPFTYTREADGWVLPRALCDRNGSDALVVSGSCPQKTMDVPRCGWTFVSGSVIDPTSRPTGFAGFAPRTYCDGTGDVCDDANDCLGRRCYPKPATPTDACFLDRHCTSPATCEGAVLCPAGSGCTPAEAAGVCQRPATTCFVDGQCQADELCVREAQCPAAGSAGLCQKRPSTCTGVPEAPVCGCDLSPYPSACAANLAGVDAYAAGNCTPCLSSTSGSFCATTLGYPASRKLVVCNGGSVVSTEECAASCVTKGAGLAACN
jgi:hypothetical protein